MSLDDNSFIREVDQELQEETQIKQLKKNLPFIVGAAVLVLAIVAGRQFYDARQNAIAEENAAKFATALEASVTDPTAGVSAFGDIAEEGSPGYAIISSFQAASLSEQQGKRAEAISYYENVINSDAAPKRLKDLARIRAGYLALEDGRDQAVALLGGLEAESSPLGYYAKEVAGLGAMQVQDYQSALIFFDNIQLATDAPASLQQRAKSFAALAQLGTQGVELSVQEGPSGQSLLQLLEQPETAEESDENDTEEPATSGN